MIGESCVGDIEGARVYLLLKHGHDGLPDGIVLVDRPQGLVDFSVVHRE
jgi:hypothetical protein